MAFEATKREWGELYAFFRLLADGYVYAGTPDVKRNEVQKLPVAMVQREEHDGTRRYILEDEARKKAVTCVANSLILNSNRH
jgi:type II restriction enzyme